MKLTHSATIKAGKPILSDPARFTADCKRFEGKEVNLTISRPKRTRSNDQNKYYWKIIIGLSAEFIGYTPEEMHDTFRIKFLTEHHETFPKVRSTTDLSTIEFKDYIEAIKILMAEQGCYLPEPNEVEV